MNFLKGTGKYFIFLVLTLIVGTIMTGCGSSTSGDDDGSKDGGDGELSGELNLFIWSEYMPDTILKQFEEETGIKVNYNVYSSNEEMLAKISAGAAGYDISVASDYMVEIMRKQNLLEKVDKENLANIDNLDPEFLNLEFDPDNDYSIPYMWGNVVIAVNKDTVKKDVTSFEDLWDTEFKNSLVVLDDQRVLIGVGNKLQGESMNSTDSKVIQKSKDLLIDLLPNIKAYDSDSPKTMLINGEAKAGIVWGAEAYLAEKENPSIQTILPDEGSNIWFDNFVIPAGAPNKKNAEAFIDFILKPEISAQIIEDFPYANPNKAAHELIDEDVMSHPAVYSNEEFLKKSEVFRDIEDAILEYDRAWSEIKQ
ncbi:family 1 extracellular solute-binding protein [Bacillus freudenreichii]|nr:family 1 extracellular solute-binding protein [Bacillus freudenreichii]